MKAAVLADRGVVRVSGAEARHFLQGLLTSDIQAMTDVAPRYAALLTPQGKIVVDMLVAQAPGAVDSGTAGSAAEVFLLDAPRALAAPLVAKLNFYRLRAKLTIEDLSATTEVLALWGTALAGAREQALAIFADPRLGALGWRAIVPAGQGAAFAQAAGAELVDAGAYALHRVELGIPDGGCDFSYGDAFPHEADLDQLNGVDFAKGCYIGQEVVSRMQHRGTARSRVVPVRIEGAAPPAGTPVIAGEKPAGALGSAMQGRGLALLRLDRVAEALAAGLPIVAGEAHLKPEKPAWATFPWPGEGNAKAAG